MRRRSVLAIPALALLHAALSATAERGNSSLLPRVGSGQDSEGKQRAIGLSATSSRFSPVSQPGGC